MPHKVAVISIFTLLATLVLIAGENNASFSCECAAPRTSDEELDAASAVFSGEVVDIDDPSVYWYVVGFDVDRSWKGITGKTVNVFTAQSTAACGYSFEIGEKYLF